MVYEVLDRFATSYLNIERNAFKMITAKRRCCIEYVKDYWRFPLMGDIMLVNHNRHVKPRIMDVTPIQFAGNDFIQQDARYIGAGSVNARKRI